jgi:hypothetical protein
MKIMRNGEASGARGAPANTRQETPGRPFSEVLEEKRRRGSEAPSSQEGEERQTEKSKKPHARESLVPTNTAVSAQAQPGLLLSYLRDVVPVDAGYSIAGFEVEPLLASLVQEISIEAPPEGPSVVDIQFDSRTLDGLHVRVQRAGEGVEVRLSTPSDAVSRLLSDNVPRLAEALARLGYVAPHVSVQRAQGSTAFSTGESAGSGRDQAHRGRHDHGGRRKNRR